MIDLTFSDYLALAALGTSVISVRYAKRQHDVATAALSNSYRSQLSDQHASYRSDLRQIRLRHKQELQELHRLAGATFSTITARFDRYDKQAQRSDQNLASVIRECAEMIYLAFKGQLAWQTGANIARRFGAFTSIEDRLAPKDDIFTGRNRWQTFEKQYRKNPNRYLEAALAEDQTFCRLVAELQSRIAPSSRVELITAIQRDIAPFLAMREAIWPHFQASIETIDELLEEGKTLHFPLAESHQLHTALARQRTVLDTLNHLWIPIIDMEDAHHYENYVSISVHACAVLETVQQVYSWGWDTADRV
ncbi:hypothetical protein [Achromobacter sp.]|uniref:hypothetical protein n=1 Tax=Achromobacter sp. TaxID=134375 RepID=UPI000EE61F03|nr:hypothetical protein [Achromobacter sp.]HCW16789.1 hypothetical protein [Achromobacter sp.]